MHETEFHDLSDDPDYAASQQQGLAGSFLGSTAGMGGGSDVGDVFVDGGEAETVYSKDNVTIHPTQYASERISGRLRLLKQGSSFFMTWVPYKLYPEGADLLGNNSKPGLSEKDRSLYAIAPVSLSDVRSIRRHTPTLGWQYMIVVLSSGLAFPPLYFYSGGLREFLATLKQHVHIVRSADDSNVFLVNNFQDPLQRSLSSLQLPRAVPITNGFSSRTANSDPLYESLDRSNASTCDESSSSSYGGMRKHKTHDPARDNLLQVLEKFSLVTKFSRDTAQIFRDNPSNTSSPYDTKLQNDSVALHTKPSEALKQPSEMLESPGHLENDELNLVWGKPRRPPLGLAEWSVFFDSEGRIMDSKALRKRIFYGGVEHGLRKEVWKLLLGYHAYESTYAEREYLDSVKKTEYDTIKNQWKSISLVQANRFTKFRERKGLIEKDVVRTDRSVSFYDGDENPNVEILHDILLSYSFYNFDLGYCQGMSDLLSPILYVMEDESEAFWCFAALMERLGPNFNRDQNGMHSQLFALSKLVEMLDHPLHNYFKQADCLNYFFCFRWILIQFKREFEYETVMRLWEVLWTYYLSEHFHLYVCVAILRMHRRKIIGDRMDFDTLLKFINELSGRIDLDSALREAEALCSLAGENGAACIPPGTPPSLPAEGDAGIMTLHPLNDDVL